jgi:hypothetical protein
MGVGTTNPTAFTGYKTLAVNGSTNGGVLELKNADVSTGLIFCDSQLLTIRGQTSTPIVFQTNGANERIRIPANAGGIQFPATQVASSDANTLDDYEEGIWTPTAFGSSTAGTTTYNDRAGFYTKVGNQVTASFYIDWSALTGTGVLRLGGIPFSVKNVSNINITGSVMTNGLNWTGGTTVVLYCNQASTFFVMYGSTDDGGWAAQSCVNEAAAVIGTITYFTD